ncbi:hypothetical protein ACOMHN_014595 [Nucella lapillus]
MDQTREERKEEWVEEEEGASGGAPISAQPLSSGPNQSPADGDEDGHIPYGIPVSDAGDGGNELTVITNQEEFLTKIHPTFLEMVHPIESQLVDELRNTEAFSSEDEQSIAGEKTRRKRARKLWGMLHRIPEEDFAHCFMPKLKERYPHVMAGLTFQLAEVAEVNSCMRHAMRRRINLKRLVDILPSLKCCSVDEYRGLEASQYCGDKEWEEVFQILHAHSSNSDLCSAVEALLRRKKVKNPERYGETADGGFVCTCHATSSAPPPCSAASGSADEEAVLKSLRDLNVPRDRESSATYPSSPKSCHVFSDMSCTDSGMGSDSAYMQPALFTDIEQFQLKAHKDQYKEAERDINYALTWTSQIRSLFRILEKTRDDARSLAKQAKDETPSEVTNKKLRKLMEEAREHHTALGNFFQKVQGTWESVSDLEACFDFDVPQDWRMFLRARHHLLRNELQECRHFLEKAAAVFEEVSHFSRPLPLAE